MNTFTALRFVGPLFLGVTSLILVGCNKAPEKIVAPAPANVAVAEISDNDLTTKVKTTLLLDPALKGFDIIVMAKKGDVRLSGVIDTQSQIEQARSLVRGIDGVHSLHDELTIKK